MTQLSQPDAPGKSSRARPESPKRRRRARSVRRSRLHRAIRGLIIGAVLWGVWAITALMPSPTTTGLALGKASPRDIKASHQVTYVSDVETRLAREEAAARVSEVYTLPDPSVAARQLELLGIIQEAVTAAREVPGLTIEERLALLPELPEIDVADDAWRAMLEISDSDWQALVAESTRVLSLVLSSEIRPSDLSRARLDVQRLMAYTLSPRDRDIVTALVSKLVVPNSFLDTEATEQKREEARSQVTPIVRTVLAGEAIVREGEIVTDRTYEKLQVLGLTEEDKDWRTQAADLGLALLVVVVLVLFTARVFPSLIDHPRQQMLLVSVLAIIAIGARLLIPGHVLMPFIFPCAAAAMLVTLFVDVRVGSLVAVVSALIVASVAGGSMELLVYTLVGCAVGALCMMGTEQLSTFFVATGLLALANVGILLLYGVRGNDYDTLGLLQLAGAGTLNALLSTALAFVAYAFTGRVFGITTSLQLMELARPTHPLFRQLLIKAPGTYHHSILIANMAESAAEAIGADALLTRVGAYYHDVGKTLRPYFFAENQADGQNPHKKLDPRTSAEIIIGHTTEGLGLARRYHLPAKVTAFIPEHHGTTLAAYFYRQAVEASRDGEELDEGAFRYPGPKPQSRETAIVMLADAVEAWSRANRPTTQAEMERLIRQVINDRLISGELDETDLTLKDLDRIRQAFASILAGVYHPRVQYPERTQIKRTPEVGKSD